MKAFVVSRRLSNPSIAEFDSSSSNSSSSAAAKKVVGGSCHLSPATTRCVPRMTAGIASSGRTWLASSKMTKSKHRVVSRSWLTDSGLAIQQGHTAVSTCRASAKSARRARCRRFFSASDRMMYSSVLCSFIAAIARSA